MKSIERFWKKEKKLSSNPKFRKFYQQLYKDRGKLLCLTAKIVYKKYDMTYMTWLKWLKIIKKHNSMNYFAYKGPSGGITLKIC